MHFLIGLLILAVLLSFKAGRYLVLLCAILGVALTLWVVHLNLQAADERAAAEKAAIAAQTTAVHDYLLIASKWCIGRIDDTNEKLNAADAKFLSASDEWCHGDSEWVRSAKSRWPEPYAPVSTWGIKDQEMLRITGALWCNYAATRYATETKLLDAGREWCHAA